MIFITTFNKDIYEICGRNLLESFVKTENNLNHKLAVFFEDNDDPHTIYVPDWLAEWNGYANIKLRVSGP